MLDTPTVGRSTQTILVAARHDVVGAALGTAADVLRLQVTTAPSGITVNVYLMVRDHVLAVIERGERLVDAGHDGGQTVAFAAAEYGNSIVEEDRVEQVVLPPIQRPAVGMGYRNDGALVEHGLQVSIGHLNNVRPILERCGPVNQAIDRRVSIRPLDLGKGILDGRA